MVRQLQFTAIPGAWTEETASKWLADCDEQSLRDACMAGLIATSEYVDCEQCGGTGIDIVDAAAFRRLCVALGIVVPDAVQAQLDRKRALQPGMC